MIAMSKRPAAVKQQPSLEATQYPVPSIQYSSSEPLASRMRPRTLDEYVGQEHLLGQGRLLRRAIENDTVRSCILWGPPGTGKTTLARLIASASHAYFSPLSAVSSGVADLRRVVAEAQERRA